MDKDTNYIDGPQALTPPPQQQQQEDDGGESAKPHFFEGVEKLLEVWFTRKDGKTRHCDLRLITRDKWETMLKVVQCEIISMTRNDTIDAYVLSESSLFVSKRRILLKTCGSTTPLLCLKYMLHLVKQFAGFDEVQDLFYSRKNYKRPELQREPHRTFTDEAALLDSMFHDGAAYCLGAVNRDCWYLYTLNPSNASGAGYPLNALLGADSSDDGFEVGSDGTEDCCSDGSCDGVEDVEEEELDDVSDESSDDSLESALTTDCALSEQLRQRLQLHKRPVAMRSTRNYGGSALAANVEPDQTLEIMMSDLDPDIMKIFTKEVSATAAEATQKSGIDKILPNVLIDDYLFEPCGYSMNGIMKNGEYMTIHITPEAEFSYVSFECNVPQSSYMDVIRRVLAVFKPATFIVTAFANETSTVEDAHKDMLTAARLGEFLRRDIQYLSCKNYDLTYALYSKFPS